MISQNNKTNSTPRIRVIQKIYGHLMNPDEQIIYSKNLMIVLEVAINTIHYIIIFIN